MMNRKFTYVLLALLLMAGIVYPQSSSRSKSGSFGAPMPSAKLSCTVEFSEPSGNGILDAGEKGSLVITVSNTGGSRAKNVIAELSSSGSTTGIRFPSSVALGDIAPKGSSVGYAEVSSADNIKTAAFTVSVIASDDNGVKADPASITVSTKDRMIVKDNTPPTIEIREPVTVSSRGLKIKSDGAEKVQTSSIKVAGIAKDESGINSVTINGSEAQLSLTKEGTAFTGEALLVLGKNEVEVKGVDKFGNQKVVKFEVSREAEIAAKNRIPKDMFKGQRWGVIVGISDYKDEDIPDLRYADKDAEAFHKFLSTPLEEGGGGVSKSNIRYLVNEEATTMNIRESLTDFLKSAIEEDIVYIYFAGHGAPDPDRPKVLYLLTHDSKLEKLGGSAIKMQEVQDILRDYVAAKSVIVFADACHSRGVSGTLATRALASPDLVNEFLSELSRSRSSTCTFSASDINQLSQEDKRWGGGHGVFTYFLIEGLKGAADSDHDRIVRLGELLLYVNDKVRRETKSQQSPMPSGSYDSSLPLAIIPQP